MIAVSEAAPAELRVRLKGTPYAEPRPVNGREAGTDTAELRRLTAHRADGWGRRAHEAVIHVASAARKRSGRTSRAWVSTF
ncbi:hypothetical protein C3488_24140 [Streptomyces sp. Ru72]|nr:hypothetical protein C3488_24140 [Streptomyces sp. Ru72]